MRTHFAEPIQIDDPIVLIRIPVSYRPGMSGADLFDVTSKFWKIGPRRDGARYALAVVQGVVVEVYKIDRWQPAGTSPSPRKPGPKDHDRWEFVGRVAKEPIQNKYFGRSVKHYFKRGNQSPIRYVNC